MAFGDPGSWNRAADANQLALEDREYRDQLRTQQLLANGGGWGKGSSSGGFAGSIGGTPSGASSLGNGGTASYAMPTVSVSTAPSVGGGANLQSASEQLRYDPWAEHRGEAGDLLAGQMGSGSPSDLYSDKMAQMVNGQFSPDDPSYQWRFQQGQQAAERSLASRGLLNSGNAAIELQQYGQGAASQEYQAQFARMVQGLTASEGAYDTQIQRLMKMAGVDIDPTAGGLLNVQQGQLGVNQGKLGVDISQLGLNAQQIGNNYATDMARIAAGLSGSSGGGGGGSYQPIYGPSGGASPSYAPVSWDAYFAARNAARPGTSTGVMDSSGRSVYREK